MLIFFTHCLLMASFVYDGLDMFVHPHHICDNIIHLSLKYIGSAYENIGYSDFELISYISVLNFLYKRYFLYSLRVWIPFTHSIVHQNPRCPNIWILACASFWRWITHNAAALYSCYHVVCFLTTNSQSFC